GLRTTASVGGCASSRSQTSVASSGGASGSSTATSPAEATHVEVTAGPQSSPGRQSGCSNCQSQSPGATSLSSERKEQILRSCRAACARLGSPRRQWRCYGGTSQEGQGPARRRLDPGRGDWRRSRGVAGEPAARRTRRKDGGDERTEQADRAAGDRRGLQRGPDG